MTITQTIDPVANRGSAQVAAKSERDDTSRSKAIPFDPHKRAGSPEMAAAVARLATFLERHEADLKLRRRSRSEKDRDAFVLSVEAIACNLVALALSSVPYLAVPRSNGAMWTKGRYSTPVYGQHFRGVLDLMAHPEVGLIENVARGYGSTNGKGQLSTIRSTVDFTKHIPLVSAQWASLSRIEEPEVLVLKGRKDPATGRASLVDYKDTAATRRMRKEVIRLNARLAHAPFWLVANEDSSFGFDKETIPVDPTKRSVRRIFNNESWYEGGRLFGGYWETMRSEDRRLLRIATVANPLGEPVVNVDYGQLFPRLAYIVANVEPPDGDLYDLGEPNWSRAGCKKVFNALLLAERPLRNWPSDTRALFPPGTRFQDIVGAIKVRHAPIAEAFDSATGLRLMRFESELLINTLQRLFAKGITALPLHDSVLVAVSEQEAAKEAMTAALNDFSPGARAKLQTK